MSKLAATEAGALDLKESDDMRARAGVEAESLSSA